MTHVTHHSIQYVVVNYELTLTWTNSCSILQYGVLLCEYCISNWIKLNIVPLFEVRFDLNSWLYLGSTFRLSWPRLPISTLIRHCVLVPVLQNPFSVTSYDFGLIAQPRLSRCLYFSFLENCGSSMCTPFCFWQERWLGCSSVPFIRVGHAYLEPNRVLDESNRWIWGAFFIRFRWFVDGFEWNKEQNYRKRVDFTIITELNVWGVLLKEINCHNTKCTVYSFLKYVNWINDINTIYTIDIDSIVSV